MTAKTQPIIVIKKKGGHGGHHGGAWKVAYADFVTAMMALFIVLWLMGSSDKVKRAVAGYFNDPKGSASQLGTTMTGTGQTVAQANAKDLEKLKARLEQEIRARTDLEKLSKQIEITITPEGLRIELLEGRNGTFYEIGSAKLSASGQELLSLLAAELKTLPNSLLIEGHTDSTPYSNNGSYSNWDLSADRANSARRILQQDGVRSNQVAQVRGYADMMLRMKDSPADPSNRRVSILIKNGSEPVPALSAGRVVDGSAPLPGAPVQPMPGQPKASHDIAGQHGVPPVLESAAKPAVQAPTQNPVKAQAAANPGLMDKLKGMMPGTKK